MKVRNFLGPKLLSDIAIGYHRTKSMDNVESIGLNSFQPGSGAFYGKGLYLTYDLQSQFNNNMPEIYGYYIVKFKIKNLSKFLIYDEEVAKIVHKHHYTIEEQLSHVFGMKKLPNEIVEALHSSRLSLEAKKFTSVLAKNLYIRFFQHSSYERFGIKGIIFTGANDGRVMVVFDMASAIAIEYTKANSISQNIVWKPVDNSGSRKVIDTTKNLDNKLNNILLFVVTFMERRGWRNSNFNISPQHMPGFTLDYDIVAVKHKLVLEKEGISHLLIFAIDDNKNIRVYYFHVYSNYSNAGPKPIIMVSSYRYYYDEDYNSILKSLANLNLLKEFNSNIVEEGIEINTKFLDYLFGIKPKKDNLEVYNTYSYKDLHIKYEENIKSGIPVITNKYIATGAMNIGYVTTRFYTSLGFVTYDTYNKISFMLKFNSNLIAQRYYSDLPEQILTLAKPVFVIINKIGSVRNSESNNILSVLRNLNSEKHAYELLSNFNKPYKLSEKARKHLSVALYSNRKNIDEVDNYY